MFGFGKKKSADLTSGEVMSDRSKAQALAARIPRVLAAQNQASIDDVLDQKKILLMGDCVYISSESEPLVPEGYVEQPLRHGASVIDMAIGRKGLNLRVYLASNVISELSKIRLGFAIDGYLGWGMYQRRPSILIGGYAASDSTYLDILVFEKGRLAEKDGRVLPALENGLFRESLQLSIDQLAEKYPGYRIAIGAPLPDFDLQGVDYVGTSSLRSVSYNPIALKEAGRSFRSYRIPAAILVGGVAVYGGLLWKGWEAYTKSQSAYQVAMQHPAIKETGGVDQAYLGVMQQRRTFMDEPRRQIALANKAEEIARGIARVPDVRVLEIKLPAPGVVANVLNGQQLVQPGKELARKPFAGDRQPDVAMAIAVPIIGSSVLDQARLVMEMVGAATGMDLRLAHQGWREEKGRRIFTIEGVIRD